MTNTAQRITPRERGAILLLALTFAGIMATVLAGVVSYVALGTRTVRTATASAQALALAEAGIEQSIYQLNQNGSYGGETITSVPGGVIVISIATAGNAKRITSTGYVPNQTNPVAVREVQANASINTSLVAFHFGVQIGNGGLSMGNGAQVHGSIFSNGNISGSGVITGDATVALGTDDNPDQKSEQQNSGFNLGDVAARTNVAMGFKPSVSALLSRTTLNIKKIGNPGDITIRIVTDNSGKPSKTVLAIGTVPASLVGSAYSYIDIAYASSTSLAASTQYWIIATAASVSSSNYYVWGDDTGNDYPNGTGKYSTDWNAATPVWNSVNADLDFRTFMEGAITSLSGVTVQGDAWAHALANCSIGGSASYQTISGCTVGGTQHPGSTDAAPAPLPISAAQIADWEAMAVAGGTIAGPYAPSGTITLGPKKIDGDLSIQNGAKLKLTGPVWVNGNVTFSNNATLTVDPSTGGSGAIIIADATSNTAAKGQVTISNNVTITGNGNPDSHPMIVTTNTGSNAIDLENNGASVILYAPWGTVDVSNNASGNQITAYRLSLQNNSSVNYVSGLQNASFSNGPGGSWAFVRGTYAITK